MRCTGFCVVVAPPAFAQNLDRPNRRKNGPIIFLYSSPIVPDVYRAQRGFIPCA